MFPTIVLQITVLGIIKSGQSCFREVELILQREIFLGIKIFILEKEDPSYAAVSSFLSAVCHGTGKNWANMKKEIAQGRVVSRSGMNGKKSLHTKMGKS